MMLNVIIIGGGKVANHLIKAFLMADHINLVQVYARKIEQIHEFKHQVAITDNLAVLKNADLYILAVADDAIEEVSSKINTTNLVVHTSGSASLQSLKNKGRKGVFYMLQSFSKHRKINFTEVPFCLEAEAVDDLRVLEQLAATLSPKIYRINSEQRRYLHVAAVFVNNFTNYLYAVGDTICKQNNIPFDVLYPIIKETAAKIEELSPKEAQTGPAIRNDVTTIQHHLRVLSKEQQQVYQLLTQAIITQHSSPNTLKKI